ncbi:MAG: dockerin type I repeat-containing protein [Clostridia bacterium]|nr:dockerin type I repeat-containing protein [Clostridia bacterium]
MKRYLAVLLCVVMLLSATPLVSADNSYNDDQFDWGEYACPHTHTEEVAEIPSTCLVQGLSGYTRCADCKLLLSGVKETLPLGDHAYDHACDIDCNVCSAERTITHAYHAVVTAPDCENGGYTTYTCSVCGDSYVVDRTTALGHTAEVLKGYAATCDKDGLTDGEQCSVCGNILVAQQTIPAVGHAYNAVVTAPDCENGGYTTYTCSVCGDSYVADRTTALGHTAEVLKGYAATCDKEGLADGEQCSVCGNILVAQQTIPAVGHSYNAVVTTPDCENSGYTVYACTVCGHSYADNRVDALGHNYQVTETVDSTCVADGKQVYTCTRCGDSYTEVIPATGRHTYGYICDEVCDVCGYVRKDAHVYTYMGTVDPTCGEDGSEGYKCWECGGYKYVILPATGNHTYSGVCDAVCNVCGYTRESVVAHNYVLTEDVAVTCTTDGKQVYTCQGCGDSYSNKITAQGHTYHIVVTSPTCEQGGYTTHTCTACGDVCVDNRTDALGHSYNAVVTAPDCENGGYTTYTCSVCGDSYVADHTSAFGHSYDDDIDADCNTCGHIRPVTQFGDINGDGKVNNRDLGLLQQYVNGFEVVVDKLASDVTGDGKINNRDLGLLQQYVNGFDVTLGGTK